MKIQVKAMMFGTGIATIYQDINNSKWYRDFSNTNLKPFDIYTINTDDYVPYTRKGWSGENFIHRDLLNKEIGYEAKYK